MKKSVFLVLVACVMMVSCGGSGDTATKGAKAVQAVAASVLDDKPFVGEWYGKSDGVADLLIFHPDGNMEYYLEMKMSDGWVAPSVESLKTGKASPNGITLQARVGSKWVLVGSGGNTGVIIETEASGKKTEYSYEVINGNILKFGDSGDLYDRVTTP